MLQALLPTFLASVLSRLLQVGARGSCLVWVFASVALAFIAIKGAIDVDEVGLFELPLRVGFQGAQTAHGGNIDVGPILSGRSAYWGG